MSQEIIVDIAIAADDYLKMYQGVAKRVYTRARDGRTVNFPAHILRPFVTREGIYGTFKIEFTAQGKLRGIKRVG